MAKRVYIAGGIRGLSRDEVMKKFYDAQRYLERWGHDVINPIQMDIDLDGGVNVLTDQLEYARRDAAVILGMGGQRRVDGIYLTDGWSVSIGSIAEAALGRWVGAEFELQNAKETKAIVEVG